MSDDLLDRLGRLARDEAQRDEEALDARWDALARGDLTPEEEEDLRREDPEAYEMFRPLDEGFRSDVADRVRRSRSSEPRPSSGNVVPFHRRGSTWVGLVAAAVVVFFVMLPLGPSDPGALPPYSVIVEGGSQSLRSDEPASTSDDRAVRRLARGDRLEVLLRPETGVGEGGVEANAYFLPTDGGAPRNVTDLLDVADSGAVRWVGTVGVGPDWPAGRVDLWIAVDRPGRLPEPEPGSETWDGVWRIPLRIDP